VASNSGGISIVKTFLPVPTGSITQVFSRKTLADEIQKLSRAIKKLLRRAPISLAIGSILS
jgi:hypothetical protein